MKINHDYAQLKDNNLVCAPNILYDGEVQIINASAEKYAEHGYFPIERTTQPEAEGFYFTPVYTEQNGRIVEGWEQHEIPDTATEAEKATAFDILMGVSE
ncbi:MAG: hypothetical protein IKK09_01710 [Clostridia bacterium]|nr:hypothetical protein [Clostridia bacterium]